MHNWAKYIPAGIPLSEMPTASGICFGALAKYLRAIAAHTVPKAIQQAACQTSERPEDGKKAFKTSIGSEFALFTR